MKHVEQQIASVATVAGSAGAGYTWLVHANDIGQAIVTVLSAISLSFAIYFYVKRFIAEREARRDVADGEDG